MRRGGIALALALATSAFASVNLGADEPGTVPLAPQLELRVQRLGKELRCAVCQGMSISDSPSSMARAQLDKVRDLVTQGKTDQEIRDYFVARYGQWILLEPPRQGFAWLVWLLPLLMLLGGGALVVRVMRTPASPAPATDPANAADTRADGAQASTDPELEDPYLKAVRAELER
jgi:cytochrome c-type biogenesis protein CcmH